MVPKLHPAGTGDKFTLNSDNCGGKKKKKIKGRETSWQREGNRKMNCKKLVAHPFCRTVASTGGYCACNWAVPSLEEGPVTPLADRPV